MKRALHFLRMPGALTAALLMVTPTTLRSVVLTFQEGTNGSVGTQDTYVHAAHPNMGFGANAFTSVSNSNGFPIPGPVHGFLRFDNLVGTGSNRTSENAASENRPSLTVNFTAAAPPTIVTYPLVPLTNALWSYNQSNNLDGVNWTATNYDDSAWQVGPSLLAFESNPEILPLIQTTLVSPQVPMNGVVCHAYYFRIHFTWPYATAGVTLFLSNRVDDGAKFYLNGIEVTNIRMPLVLGYYTNFAQGFPPTPTLDATSNEVVQIDSTYLRQGDNVLAASVHQANANSTDIVFGSALTALTALTPSPPTISPIGDQTTSEDNVVGPLAFTVGDVETPAANLLLSATSTNPGLVPTNQIGFGGSGSNRTVTVTPAANQFGTSWITITVTDANGGTASSTFLVTINPVNDPPTISDIANQTINVNTSTGPLAFTVRDEETLATDLILFRNSDNPTLVPPGNIVLSGSGTNRTVTVTPATNQCGTAAITVSVHDGTNSASEMFLLTVANFSPPEIFCPPHLVVAADPGGSSKSNLTYAVYAWDLCETNMLAICAPPSGSTFPTGTTVVRCLAANTAGYSNQCSFTVTVWDLAEPLDILAATNASVMFCVSGSGPAPVSYHWRKNLFVLAGETNACLTLNHVTVTNGGTYDVVIHDALRDTLSAPVHVIIDVTNAPPGADVFNTTNQLFGSAGLIRGSNANATRQEEEPWHAGLPGFHSVWYTWRAPTNGIATFHTRGSTFDTLLAVYTGTHLSGLATNAVAGDEDQGGCGTSEVQFNASAGTDYRIAVDGFEAAQGTFLLSWSFEETMETLPVIVSPPVPKVVCQGQNAVLSVTAVSTNVTYQWLFKGVPIPGATSSNLIITNVQAPNLGLYSVRVTNQYARAIQSPPVEVQTGSSPDISVTDKPFLHFKACAVQVPRMVEMSDGGIDGPAGPQPTLVNASQLPATQCLGVGQTYAFRKEVSPQGGVPISCSIEMLLTSVSFGLEPTNSGHLVISASDYNTGLIAAYYWGLSGWHIVKCDPRPGDADPDKIAQLSFPVEPGTIYTILIDTTLLTKRGTPATVGAECALYPTHLSLSSSLHGLWTLSAEHILNLPSFAAQLQQRTDLVSQYLYGRLSDGPTRPTKSLLNDYKNGQDYQLQEALVVDLNAIVLDGSIYDRERFNGVLLRPETTTLLRLDPTSGEKLERLNRLLLEDAYPTELWRNRQYLLSITYSSAPCVTTCPLILETNQSLNSEGWGPVITNALPTMLPCDKFVFTQIVNDVSNVYFYRARFGRCADPCTSPR